MRTDELTLTELKRMLSSATEETAADLITQLKGDPRKQARELADAWLRRQDKLRREKDRLRELFAYERRLWSSQCLMVAGVDEVGRGPLAGPVMAAAVILDREIHLPYLNDSKKLSPSQREQLEDQIKTAAVCWSIGLASPEEIDRLNIRVTSLLAMRRAVEKLSRIPQHILVDAFQIPGLPQPQTPIIKGDSRSASIAAASILAKVERDRLMDSYAALYPGYGFDNHKGYPTPEHIQALARLGPSPIHRLTFTPVRDLLKEDHPDAGSLF